LIVRSLALLMSLLVPIALVGAAASEQQEAGLKITVVYNNVACDTALKTDWGFSCLLEGTEKVILFDTGGNGSILFDNMRKLDIAPSSIEALVLSHIHGDHTGGVSELLNANRDLHVYVPASFPPHFIAEVETLSAQLVKVEVPTKVCGNVWTTGVMGTGIREQGLVASSDSGLIVITGCAHPGIVQMVGRAKEILSQDVYLAMGGFHLMNLSQRKALKVMAELKELGVRKVAPSHCTGKNQIRMFKEAYGEDFIEGGCGCIIQIR